MSKKATLERWSEEETQELLSLSEANPGLSALQVAEKHKEKHPDRTVDAIKQRVFKMRRESSPNYQPASRKPKKQKREVRLVPQPKAAKTKEQLPPVEPEVYILKLPGGGVSRGPAKELLAILEGLSLRDEVRAKNRAANA